MSAASDYFAAMFTSDVSEAVQEEIKLHDVDPQAMEMLVQYMYTGERDADTLNQVISILILSDVMFR